MRRENVARVTRKFGVLGPYLLATDRAATGLLDRARRHVASSPTEGPGGVGWVIARHMTRSRVSPSPKAGRPGVLASTSSLPHAPAVMARRPEFRSSTHHDLT